MKKTLALLTLTLAVGLAAVTDAEAARRLGGGKSSGMQRESVTAPARSPAATPNPQPASPTQAAPAAAGAPAAAAAAQSSRSKWLGPIAGIAAGLGIAALASHFGFGEALANMLTFALIAMAVLMVIGFILRKRAAASGQGQPAWAGAASGAGAGQPAASPMQRSAADRPRSLIGSGIGSGTATGIGSAVQPGATSQIPADFDTQGFARNAKDNFMQLQAANDAGDLDRLRGFLAPQMFEEVRRDIETRGSEAQRTEVFGLEAEVLQVAEEASDWIASVRFTGRIRHEAGAVPEDFDEVWHLSKPRSGAGGWVIAGIQQA